MAQTKNLLASKKKQKQRRRSQDVKNSSSNDVLCSLHVPDTIQKMVRRLHKAADRPFGFGSIFWVVFLMSSLVLWISRFQCFRVHMGLHGDFKDMKFKYVDQVVDGYLDFHFQVKTKHEYDAEAIAILEAHPHINVKDLKIEFMIDVDQMGGNPLLANQLMAQIEKGEPISIDPSRPLVGIDGNAPTLKVTGDMVRKAIQKYYAALPKPSNHDQQQQQLDFT